MFGLSGSVWICWNNKRAKFLPLLLFYCSAAKIVLLHILAKAGEEYTLAGVELYVVVCVGNQKLPRRGNYSYTIFALHDGSAFEEVGCPKIVAREPLSAVNIDKVVALGGEYSHQAILWRVYLKWFRLLDK